MNNYPYYKNIHNKLQDDFKDLVDYTPQFLNLEQARKITNGYKFEKCDNDYAIVLIDYKKHKNINDLTNYFSEECRVLCKKYNKNKNPYDVFLEIKDDMRSKSKNIVEFRDNILDHMWKNNYFCQLFKISVIKALYLHFNATNILDFAAGWGDRLIASLSLQSKNIKYTGVDPSVCMKNIYGNIIKSLAKTNNYKVINAPFEDVKLNGKYDFIFSSPPFFKLEVYENTYSQSINKFPSLEKWKELFLYKLIKKCEKHLQTDKYFCIHISEYKGVSYINDMLDYIKYKTKLKYVGRFYYIIKYEDGSHTHPMSIRVFKKIS
jgi:16S rRNA G966 N2-methylase RsmD